MNRRWMVASVMFAGVMVAGGRVACGADEPAKALAPTQVSVRDYGAKGDGVVDDTGAFERAMAVFGGKAGTVSVPVGQYLIKSHLTIPAKITLEGVWKIPTAFTQPDGSTLLAVEGKGDENGTPFITLGSNAVLKGLTVFYPDQKPDHIAPYPWCVRGAGGDNSSIIDCLLVNPYQAVDFGTNPSGRHYIRNLYGQPLRRGIFVDKCFDIGRIENVHFWPFWNWDEKNGIRDWLWKNGEAFVFGRTDWEYVLNTFVFGYKTGYRFIQTKDGATNGNFLGVGADASQNAVVVDQSQPYGLLFTNGEFVSMAGVDPTEVIVGPKNTGAVNFANCAFWGPARQIANLGGSGTTSFSNCNFIEWDNGGKGTPAITLSGGSLMVSSCSFVTAAPQAELVGKAESAVLMGNKMGGPLRIANPANADLQVGLNVFGKAKALAAEEPGAVVVDDNKVTFSGAWKSVSSTGNYAGWAHWAVKGTGEAKATFRLKLPHPGKYAVWVFASPDPNHDHATNVPLTVKTAAGTRAVRISQRNATGGWVKAGEYAFSAVAVVTLSNNANGNVIADAVKAVPAR